MSLVTLRRHYGLYEKSSLHQKDYRSVPLEILHPPHHNLEANHSRVIGQNLGCRGSCMHVCPARHPWLSCESTNCHHNFTM
eukprot:1141576-Pelagomonas_calceolata.AAC.2